ncbi:MAG: CarD family transcriptional regulator [Terriglobia bacterium]
MQFSIGDKVIYPNHGVGVIERINSREVSGHRESFYQLKMVANSMMVMIPVANVEDVGLRKLIKKEAVNEVLDHLKRTSVRCHADWKNRYKENSDKMRTGSIFDVADVFKSLYSLSHERVLSFREKKMLDRARYLVISELSTVWDLPELKVQELVEHTLDEKGTRKGHA